MIVVSLPILDASKTNAHRTETSLRKNKQTNKYRSIAARLLARLRCIYAKQDERRLAISALDASEIERASRRTTTRRIYEKKGRPAGLTLDASMGIHYRGVQSEGGAVDWGSIM